MRRKVEQIGEKELVFKALCDGGRLQILRLLQREELNATQILEKVDLVQSTLSHHMKVLTDAGILTTRRAGKATYYQISAGRIRQIIGWGEAFLAEYLGEELPVENGAQIKPKEAESVIAETALPEEVITEPETAEEVIAPAETAVRSVEEALAESDEVKPEKAKKDKAKKKDKKDKKNKKDKKEKKSKKEKKEKK